MQARLGDAEARGAGHERAVGQLVGGFEGLADAVGRRVGAVGVGLLGDDELVPAEPGHDVRTPDRRLEPPRRLDEHGVAGGVAVGVVDRLEVVEVDVGDHERRGGPLDPGQGRAEQDVEEAAVGEPGQRVAQCQRGEVVLQPAHLRDVAPDALDAVVQRDHLELEDEAGAVGAAHAHVEAVRERRTGERPPGHGAAVGVEHRHEVRQVVAEVRRAPSRDPLDGRAEVGQVRAGRGGQAEDGVGRAVGEVTEPGLRQGEALLGEAALGDVAADGEDVCAVGSHEVAVGPLDPPVGHPGGGARLGVTQVRRQGAEAGELRVQAVDLGGAEQVVDGDPDELLGVGVVLGGPRAVAVDEREVVDAVARDPLAEQVERLRQLAVAGTHPHVLLGHDSPDSFGCGTAAWADGCHDPG